MLYIHSYQQNSYYPVFDFNCLYFTSIKLQTENPQDVPGRKYRSAKILKVKDSLLRMNKHKNQKNEMKIYDELELNLDSIINYTV
ncbi:CLUMA_CG018583, isoform A [Clunio marinus]|uniref:CLUMA_CG018583, isoform A n=1 Tax=Clunio marinus TaxID=568069 RepID=A0A1J1IXK8_9DIPT|nr:CLUMA_CG018583, isoform A [Clunio marinus]